MGNAVNHRKFVLDKVRSLRLRGFDWDGSGGLPVRDDAAQDACDVYKGPGLLNSDLACLSHPDVTASDNGTIEVAYSEPDTDKGLLLTFQCRGVVTYVQVFEDGQTTVEGTIRLGPTVGPTRAGAGELQGLFEWLCSE